MTFLMLSSNALLPIGCKTSDWSKLRPEAAQFVSKNAALGGTSENSLKPDVDPRVTPQSD
jgi:hypothetical protein